MYGVTLLIAASALGVDYGWQPVEGDSLEYIIQIEPELVAALEAGEAITSEIPADVGGVRRFRIQIGDADLPQVEHEPLAGGAGGVPTPAQPAHGEFTHGDHTHSDAAAADHPPVIPPPPASGGDSGSIYGESGGGSIYGEQPVSPAQGDTPATSSGGEFEAPRSIDPPRAAESGSDLFTGSGGMIGSGQRGSDSDDGPSLDLPLLEPPRGTGSETEVAQPSTPPITLPPPSPSPFRQPDLLSPAEPASELTGFEAEAETGHDDHEGHDHAAEGATSAPQRAPEAEPAATSRPWLPLTLTLLLLFASIGGNLYLGWILFETLARYRRLQTEQAE